MKINVTDKKPNTIKSDLYVVLVEENGDPGAATSELSADVRKAVAARAKSVGYKAKKGATLSVQTTSGDVLVCAVSSGDGASEALRRAAGKAKQAAAAVRACLLYTSPSPRDKRQSRMPSSA